MTYSLGKTVLEFSCFILTESLFPMHFLGFVRWWVPFKKYFNMLMCMCSSKCIYLEGFFIWNVEWQTDLPLAASLLTCPAQPGSEARSQHHLGFYISDSDPGTQAVICCFPNMLADRSMDGKGSVTETPTSCCSVGCEHPNKKLNLLCHKTPPTMCLSKETTFSYWKDRSIERKKSSIH